MSGVNLFDTPVPAGSKLGGKHMRVFHCDNCGRDDIIDDPVDGKPLICSETHPPDMPCVVVACPGCVEAVLEDRAERRSLWLRTA